MNKFRNDSNQQRDDIVSWFRSMPGLIFSGIVMLGFVGVMVAQVVIGIISQGGA